MARPLALATTFALSAMSHTAHAFQEEALIGPSASSAPSFQAVPEQPADSLSKDAASPRLPNLTSDPSRSTSYSSSSSGGTSFSSSRMAARTRAFKKDYLGPVDVGLGIGVTRQDFNGRFGITYNVDRIMSARLDYGYVTGKYGDGHQSRALTLLSGRAAYLNTTIFVPYVEMGPGYETFKYTEGNALHHEGYSAVLYAALGLELRFTPYFALVFQRKNTNYLNSTDRNGENGDWDRRASRNDVYFQFVL